MQLRLHNFIPRTRAEGPGTRACVQVQGCSICCAGCGVPQTWSTQSGRVVHVPELIHTVLGVSDIQGVTFLGGEPFDQALALAEVGTAARATGLSVMTFTGYQLDWLTSVRDEAFDALLAVTDLLVDGPFVRELSDLTRPWVGSTNQQFHFLTDRYQYLRAELKSIPNRLEVRIRPDGIVSANGMAPVDSMRGLFDLE